ncbi:hypothetical protein K2173_016274 [Erythroxylum novogranatense]|uniref:AB hydrolase-1 domain-containing protein n=1 Tax=Erythroxylum novogranatense TaxID=1862640 RepID=A0AAV8SFZ8_9ROSI|nr:hypothetical protein K2173_016274 [Erythroxylum novogranatense]
MALSFLSFASLYNAYLRRCLTGAGLSRQAVDIDGETTIHFWGPDPHQTTSNKTSLVFIHGFGPVAMWQWRRQVQFFGPDYNVYVPDLVFFGDSTTKSTERSEVFQATSVAKLLEKLGVEKYHVVGTSYGGMIAYHMARLWPERVAGKVVIASSGVNMSKSDHDELLKRGKQESIGNLMLPQNASQLRALVDVAANRQLNMIPDFFLNDFVKRLFLDDRDKKLELLHGVSVGRDEFISITPLKQDVLLVWGDNDRIFPLEMARKLQSTIGEQVKLEIIPNASHMPQIDRPMKFNYVLKNFFDGSS